MFKYVLVILTLMLTQCAHTPQKWDYNPQYSFDKYVQAFEVEYGEKIVDLDISFGDPKIYFLPKEVKAIAACMINWGYMGSKKIVIDASFWDRITEDSREQLIFHELGHCVLGLDHIDKIKKGCPVSIMNSYAFSQDEIVKCYIPNKRIYFNRLFKNRDKKKKKKGALCL